MNPGHATPYTGPTGSVEGTIRIQGPPAPDAEGLNFSFCPDGQGEYGKLFREGPAGPDGSRPVADAVVTVVDYQGFVPERREAERATIVGCGYDARTYAMTFGQRLDIANASPKYWAPELQGAEMPALMVAPPNGDAVKLYPPKPGRYRLHDQMRHTYAVADVYVLLQPLHAVSDVAGHYRIDGVPVGKAKVGVTLPATGSFAKADVDVAANEVKTVDLVVSWTPRLLHEEPGPATTDGGRPFQPVK